MAYKESQYRQLLKRYTEILAETYAGKNLAANLSEVEEAVKGLTDIIFKEREKGDTPALDNMKNDFYYLKYEILERI